MKMWKLIVALIILVIAAIYIVPRTSISIDTGDYDQTILDFNNRGFTYYSNGQYERAIADYSKAIQLESDFILAYINRGHAFIKMQRYDEAIADFCEVIRCSPNALEGYCNRGIAFAMKGEHDRAISDFNKTLEINPRFAEAYTNPRDVLAYNNRGIVYRTKGQYDQAFSDFNKAIQIAPDFAGAYINRGVTYNTNANYNQAISDYTSAIEIEPRSANAYFSRGNVYLFKHQFDQAISDYVKSIEISPAFSPSYNNLAWLLATCPEGKYRDGHKAVENATRACELAQWANSNFLGSLAAAYAEAGEFELAIKWQTKAIELATPDYDMSAAQSSLKLYKAGKPYREELTPSTTYLKDQMLVD